LDLPVIIVSIDVLEAAGTGAVAGVPPLGDVASGVGGGSRAWGRTRFGTWSGAWSGAAFGEADQDNSVIQGSSTAICCGDDAGAV